MTKHVPLTRVNVNATTPIKDYPYIHCTEI